MEEISSGFRLLTHEWVKKKVGDAILSSTDFSAAIRGLSIEMCGWAKTAHLGSVLSCADILSVVFSGQEEDLQVNRGEAPFFILSKGHAALGLYSSMLLKSMISLQDFLSYAQAGSALEEHPSHRIPDVLLSTGSLGHGLGFMAGKIQGSNFFGKRRGGIVLMSDGECNEGTVWEAALYSAAKKIEGLVAVIDANGFQATGPSSETFGLARVGEIFRGFGWVGVEVDGHNVAALKGAISEGLSSRTPFFVVAHTVKGKGVSFMEDDNNWHYRSPSPSEVGNALKELGIA